MKKVNKGTRGMPRLSEAKKDVISCDKLRVLSLLLSSLVIFFLFQYVKELFFRLFSGASVDVPPGDVENNGFERISA